VIAVRVLRDGVFVRETLFRDLPVTFGRGPENDVVLFDPSVSRAHARLDTDELGRAVLRDLGSRNQLFRDGRSEPLVVVNGLLRVWMGRVELEVEVLSTDATQDVRLEDRPHPERRRGLVHFAADLAAGVVAVLATTMSNPAYWSPLSEDRWLSLAVSALATVVLLPVAAVVLLIVLKAIGRRVRFADALGAVAGVLWLLPAAALLSFLTYYVFRPEPHAVVEGLFASGAGIVTVVWLASVRRRGPNGRFRLAWGFGVAVLAAATAAASTSCSERMGAPSVNYKVQPPVLRWTGPRVTLDAHFERVREEAAASASEAEAARVRQRVE
jgi:FHA domain-containing protein